MARRKIRDIILEDLNSVIDIQCSDGNWNYDDYMRGMANGLLLARSIVDGKSPAYMDSPEFYLEAFEMVDRLLELGVILKPTEQELEDYKKRQIVVAVK